MMLNGTALGGATLDGGRVAAPLDVAWGHTLRLDGGITYSQILSVAWGHALRLAGGFTCSLVRDVAWGSTLAFGGAFGIAESIGLIRNAAERYRRIIFRVARGKGEMK